MPLFTVNDWEWLDSLGSEEVDQLFGSDRDSGLLSQWDYSRLKQALTPEGGAVVRRFLPTALVFTGAALGYIVERRMPLRQRLGSVHWQSLAGGAIGSFVAYGHAAMSDRVFQANLENPAALQEAFRNARARAIQLQKDQRRAQQNSQENSETEIAWHDETTSSPPRLPTEISRVRPIPTPAPAPPTIRQSISRWDEIRAVNARNPAKTSSWDVLRENHERERVSASGRNTQPLSPTASSSFDSDRASEQARFDALLEAERKRSS